MNGIIVLLFFFVGLQGSSNSSEINKGVVNLDGNQLVLANQSQSASSSAEITEASKLSGILAALDMSDEPKCRLSSTLLASCILHDNPLIPFLLKRMEMPQLTRFEGTSCVALSGEKNIAFLNDGQGLNKALKLLDLGTGKELGSIKVLPDVKSASFSKTGDRFMIELDSSFQIFDTNSRALLFEVAALGCSFYDEGKKLIAIHKRSVDLWDIETKEKIFTCNLNADVENARFNQGDGFPTTMIRNYSVKTNFMCCRQRDRRDGVEMCVEPAQIVGNFLALETTDGVRVIDLKSRKLYPFHRIKRSAYKVFLIGQGEFQTVYLVSLSYSRSGVLGIRNLSKNEAVGYTIPTYSLLVPSDEEDKFLVASENGTRSLLRIFDVTTGEVLLEIKDSLDYFGNRYKWVSFYRNKIVRCSQDGEVKVWDATTGKCLVSTNNCVDYSFNYEGDKLLIIWQDNLVGNEFRMSDLGISKPLSRKIQIWDLEKGAWFGTLKIPISSESGQRASGEISQAIFSKQGDKVVVLGGGLMKDITIFDIGPLNKMKRFLGRDDTVSSEQAIVLQSIYETELCRRVYCKRPLGVLNRSLKFDFNNARVQVLQNYYLKLPQELIKILNPYVTLVSECQPQASFLSFFFPAFGGYIQSESASLVRRRALQPIEGNNRQEENPPKGQKSTSESDLAKKNK